MLREAAFAMQSREPWAACFTQHMQGRLGRRQRSIKGAGEGHRCRETEWELALRSLQRLVMSKVHSAVFGVDPGVRFVAVTVWLWLWMRVFAHSLCVLLGALQGC